MKSEIVQIQQNVVQNQTATMLEIGTHLLNQTAEQTRKLTDVEAQVLNQTSRIEIQLLENSLSTNKLETQLLIQTNEIQKLQNRNRVNISTWLDATGNSETPLSLLETRVQEMEKKHLLELEGGRLEKQQLQQLVLHQSSTIEGLEKTLLATNSNSSLLQQQQLQLLESVQNLVQLVAQGKVPSKKDDRLFQDCAEIQQSGLNLSGVYALQINNLTEPQKAYCDMETDAGGWTVIQQRINGSISFQRNWKEYKQGFGDPPGEYWLGNEAVHLLTNQGAYSLRVELVDWEGNRAYAQYEKFQLGSERQRYSAKVVGVIEVAQLGTANFKPILRDLKSGQSKLAGRTEQALLWKTAMLSLRGYKGTAGKQSGLVFQGTGFSTRDSDNDNCICKCAQMLSGGWWFDACGLSNLNGVYYPAGHNIRKLNGIRWHYFQGPGYSLKSTRMMIRPSSGREGA
ncbi:UNVERIFIED_CONTAM: hypothetical protein K2H54_074015 [Gekko kuhli]